jgi:hypothetical protein
MDRAALVTTAYDALIDVIAQLDEEMSWLPTACLGWSVGDLVHHCTMDAQRALVALHTPADRAADTDSVDYWRGWGTDPEADDRGRRYNRVRASLYGDWHELRDLHADTSRAAARAGAQADPALVVLTQGHAITVEDLLSTLAVEAAIHHLDLVAHLPDHAAAAGSPLREARRVLDALGPAAFPAEWSDRDVVLVGTGRAIPTAAQREQLGPAGEALPLFS